MIGIVGGVGPYAGLDLAKNVFDNTIANSDQEHVDLVMLSASHTITDRTEYLMGRDETNPAPAIADVLLRMEKIGATVAGIPCNTAHALEIFPLIEARLQEEKSSLQLLNMALETVQAITKDYPEFNRVGVLSTTGTYQFKIYSAPLAEAGIEPVVPDFETQESLVHAAIYDREYGIKAHSNPVTAKAREDLLTAGRALIDNGAQLLIKGCTEIVLAVPEEYIDGIPTIDPSIVLARRLVEIEAPLKLKDGSPKSEESDVKT